MIIDDDYAISMWLFDFNVLNNELKILYIFRGTFRISSWLIKGSARILVRDHYAIWLPWIMM